jgi:peptidoglycan/LPS O-acetylase OafA/YrhL
MQTLHSRQTIPEGSPFARHLPALDGIRGLAILGVAASHLFPANPHSSLQSIIHTTFAFGANGVDLFFVLSGFLITGILYDSLPDPAFFRKFYARRILRIFPLYYGVLVIFALAALIFGLNFHHELLSLALYLQNSYLIAQPIRNYGGPTGLPLSHFWSLAIEEQFYFVWPITVFLLRKRRHLLLFCATSLVLCPLLRLGLLLHGVNYFLIQSNTLCRADSLLAGGALALLIRGQFHNTVLRAAGWLFPLGLLAYVLMAATFNNAFSAYLSLGIPQLLFAGNSAIAAASTGLIALGLRSRYTGSFFSLKSMRWLGKYSYGIYVFHLILFSYLEEPIRHAIHMHVTQRKGAVVVLAGLLIFLISIAVAYLSYHLYEKRFLSLKRFFDYRHHSNTASLT